MDEKMLQTLEDSFDNIQEGCGPLSGSIAAAGGIELIAEVRRLRGYIMALEKALEMTRDVVDAYSKLLEGSTNEGK